MTNVVLVAGMCMMIAAITVYLIDIFGIGMPLLAGMALVGVGGILSVLGGD